MNIDHLFTLYDRAAEAPDAVSNLRRFVLDLAVRGKLVEQDPEDEPASELLKRIASEKARMVRKGEIRKQKVFSAPREQPPFSIPENWRWVRIREITSDRGQKIPDEAFTYVDVTAIDGKNGIVIGPRVLNPSEAPSRARKIAQLGDVIYSCVRPYLLNVAIIEDDFDPPTIASTAFEILNGHGLVLPRYIWTVLRSPFMVACVENNQRGQAYPAINSTDFAVLPFPLPPLVEQHRIVAKIDKLIALCDQLEDARTVRKETYDRLTQASLTRLNALSTDTPTFRFHVRFAVDALPALTARADQIKHLRQTILNLAVRGQLVEQEPADEPASELLKRIEVERAQTPKTKKHKSYMIKGGTVDADFFDLPNGWEWMPLAKISDIIMGQSPPGDTYNRSGDGVPLINGPVEFTEGPFGQTTVNQFTTAPTNFCEEGDLLICVRGSTTGRTNVAAFRACIGRGVAAIRSSFDDGFIRLFLWKMREDIIAMGRGIAFPSISKKQLENLPIPVPPLAEQYRVVSKVHELMALCDRLETGLAAADGIRDRLLNSLLHSALAPTTHEVLTIKRIET